MEFGSWLGLIARWLCVSQVRIMVISLFIKSIRPRLKVIRCRAFLSISKFTSQRSQKVCKFLYHSFTMKRSTCGAANCVNFLIIYSVTQHVRVRCGFGRPIRSNLLFYASLSTLMAISRLPLFLPPTPYFIRKATNQIHNLSSTQFKSHAACLTHSYTQERLTHLQLQRSPSCLASFL